MKYVIAAIIAILVAVPIASKGVPALMADGERAAAVDVERGKAAAQAVRDMLRPAFDTRSDETSQHDRARWACSRKLQAMAIDPESVRWVRRSAWIAAEIEAGVWEVNARYEAKNALGVLRKDNVKLCTLRTTGGGEFVVTKVE